jgi:alpha-L-rhamnosidase
MKNPTRGRRISIAYAEALLPNGELDATSTVNFQRGEFCPHIDSYIPRGDEYEIYEPRFSNHSFRYAMIMNFPAQMWSEDCPEELFLARAQFVHSPILKASCFNCSDADIQALYEISRLSELDNLVTIPTDCPSRERHGWLGDALVTSEAECIQFDMLNLLESWLRTIEDDQNESGNLQYISPCMSDRINGKIDISWCCAAVMIPYFVYMEYGDKNILEKSFAMIERW